jgi:hypothetical protein
MARYAQGTTVSVENSMSELRRVVIRYGGSNLTISEDDANQAAAVLFTIAGRWVRFIQRLPDRKLPHRSTSMRGGRSADPETRRRWRVLILKVKTRLEEYADGESTFEETLLPFAVLPDNRTVAEALGPELKAMYEDGRMPKMLEHRK